MRHIILGNQHIHCIMGKEGFYQVTWFCAFRGPAPCWLVLRRGRPLARALLRKQAAMAIVVEAVVVCGCFCFYCRRRHCPHQSVNQCRYGFCSFATGWTTSERTVYASRPLWPTLTRAATLHPVRIARCHAAWCGAWQPWCKGG